VGKGEETRERIVDRAFRLATRDGLAGITIGWLADELGMSKSGLFAHFGSKEDLQIAVLDAAAIEFEDTVVRPAFAARRGLPRLRALFENWLLWITDPKRPGGCLFVAAATELDDRDGRPRDRLVGGQLQLIKTIAKGAQLAIEAGQFRSDLDCTQFAFDLLGIMLAYNHHKRLLRDPKAEARATASFNRLIEQAAEGR
jgi:AcrR family transcriptional regulator